jgi:hypothetical protein
MIGNVALTSRRLISQPIFRRLLRTRERPYVFDAARLADQVTCPAIFGPIDS